jgi:hypothetical protein
MAAIGGQLLGPGDGLLCFDRQFVEAKCHEFSFVAGGLATPDARQSVPRP